MSSKTTSSTDRVGAAAGGTPHRRPLPPGQWRIDRFPRFGTDLTGPPPPVPLVTCTALKFLWSAVQVQSWLPKPLVLTSALTKTAVMRPYVSAFGRSTLSLPPPVTRWI